MNVRVICAAGEVFWLGVCWMCAPPMCLACGALNSGFRRFERNERKMSPTFKNFNRPTILKSLGSDFVPPPHSFLPRILPLASPYEMGRKGCNKSERRKKDANEIFRFFELSLNMQSRHLAAASKWRKYSSKNMWDPPSLLSFFLPCCP